VKKLVLALVLLSNIAWSNDFTTVTIGYGPGGTDTLIRTMIHGAEENSNLKFVVENKPGANGSIALKSYFLQPANNKSVLGVSGGQILFEALANPENNYISKLKFVGPVFTSPLAIAVRDDSKFKTIASLFDKRIPRQRINIAVAGQAHEMLVDQIIKYSHHDIVAVRYKGSNDAYAALLGGQVDMQSDVYGFFKPKTTVRTIAVAQPFPIDNVSSINKYAPVEPIINFFAIAVNQDVVDTRDLSDALTVGIVKNNQVDYFKNQGYNIDLNRKSDFVEREVIPTYKKWKKLL